MMRKLYTLSSHLTVILALMFLVFLVLDQFNPMMNFIDNDYSRILLGFLCLSGLAQSLLRWHISNQAASGSQPLSTEIP